MSKKDGNNKFSPEELEEVKEIQQKYVTIQHRLGQLSVARIRLDQQTEALNVQEDELAKTFTDIQISEKEFIESVTEKYGDGVLDPETGIYSKTEE